MMCCAKSRRRSSELSHSNSSNNARTIGVPTNEMTAKTISAASGVGTTERRGVIVGGMNALMTATVGGIHAKTSDASGPAKTG